MPLHPEEVLASKDRLSWPLPWVTSFFLPHNSLGVGERGFDQVVTQLHQLTGTIYQHVIDTFNACSWGPTHWSLTDTGGSYNLRGVSFPHTTPRPSQPMVFTFHLRVPPSLRLSIQQILQLNQEDQTLNLTSRTLHSTSIISYHLSIACTNGNH
jgi:hypothetical protein